MPRRDPWEAFQSRLGYLPEAGHFGLEKSPGALAIAPYVAWCEASDTVAGCEVSRNWCELGVIDPVSGSHRASRLGGGGSGVPASQRGKVLASKRHLDTSPRGARFFWEASQMSLEDIRGVS